MMKLRMRFLKKRAKSILFKNFGTLSIYYDYTLMIFYSIVKNSSSESIKKRGHS